MRNLPLGKGPKKSLEKPLMNLRDAILMKDTLQTEYHSLSIPRFAYKLIVESNWKRAIKANRGRVKDLKRRFSL
jgi:hypothetical protein